jgi:hypothetical protein
MSNSPNYLVCNPIHNGFNQAPMVYKVKQYLDLFDEIRYKRELEPIQLYKEIPDTADPNCYNNASNYALLRIRFISK